MREDATDTLWQPEGEPQEDSETLDTYAGARRDGACQGCPYVHDNDGNALEMALDLFRKLGAMPEQVRNLLILLVAEEQGRFLSYAEIGQRFKRKIGKSRVAALVDQLEQSDPELARLLRRLREQRKPTFVSYNEHIDYAHQKARKVNALYDDEYASQAHHRRR